MVAPYAKSAVETVHGISPFEFGAGKDGVVGEPNKMFTRSLWAYDAQGQTTLQGVVDSMRRVATFSSALASGDTLGPSAPPIPPNIGEAEEFFGNSLRPSALSSRFILWPDVFEEPPDLQAIEYDERFFISIFKPIPGVLVPSDFFKVEIGPGPLTGVSCSLGKSLHFDFSSMNADTHEDTTGDDWAPALIGGMFLPFQLFFQNPPAPLIFLNDGTDGNPPVPLGLGRTVDQQVAYIQDPKNASGLYFGYAFQHSVGSGNTEPGVISLGVPYSASMGHG